jgi:predicted acyltransferase
MPQTGSVAGSRVSFLSTFVSRTLEHRDYAIDVVRGLAIVGMVLVNHEPPTDSIYPPLVHSLWNGWTVADTIFPLFLFLVGVSIALAMKRPGGEGGAPERGAYWKIGRRSFLLFAIGVALVNFPYYELYKLKLTGVLTHIALCYMVVALIHLHTTWRTQLALIPAIWLVHWALLGFLEVPGFGPGVLTPEGNASRYVDQLLLGSHSNSLQIETDIDGVLVTLSSITTTMIGLLTGKWIKNARDVSTKIAGMFTAGFALFVLGNVWDLALPINKLIWTGSFVALAAGISLQLLAAGYWIMEFWGFRYWARPLQIAGVNALTFYVFAGAVQRVLVYGRVYGEDGAAIRLRYLIYERLFSPWVSSELGALAYALVYLFFCFAFIVLLYKKNIFIKL